MTKIRAYRCIAASLAALIACPAYAEETSSQPAIPPQPAVFSQPVSQTLYKGVIGNLLEEVPIEPETRVDLQRGNAVISNTLSGRSLAVVLGITNPVLMAVGLAWGLFAASRITPTRAQAAPSNPFPGAVGTVVDHAVVSSDGTIARPHGALLCADDDPEAQPAAVRSADEPLALNR